MLLFLIFLSFSIRQDATASLILLWKVTTERFKQCSLIDATSVTLLQAMGGLVLTEEMLELGNNYFIGKFWFNSRLQIASFMWNQQLQKHNKVHYYTGLIN